MKKVCIFGDSISKGVILDTIDNRYHMTKNSFVNYFSDYKPCIHIKNYAMFGCTVIKGRSLIDRHAIDVNNCDVLLLEYGGNDCDFDWSAIADAPGEKHLPKTPLDVFADSYHDIIKRLSSLGKKIILMNLPPIDENNYFSWFSRGLDQDNIIKWLGGDTHYIYEYQASYSDKVCEIAAEYGLQIIDIREEFLRQPNYSDFLCRDGIHPNDKGHALIVQKIKNIIPQLC